MPSICHALHPCMRIIPLHSALVLRVRERERERERAPSRGREIVEFCSACICAGGYDEAMRRIFEEWDFDAILPCHGDFVPSNGKEVLRQHLRLQ